jgi:cyclophilin family peptidyl-prolyl cis-trans isomerase
MPEAQTHRTQEEIEQMTQQADEASKAEDWERAVTLFRQLQDADRIIHGNEAKLQWALRMRDIDNLYKQGKAHLQAQRYNEALGSLRKARLMYASHYKDVDALIVDAQTALQKQNWGTRPVTSQKKGCFLLGGALALLTLAVVLAACASTPTPAPTVLPAPTSGSARAGNLTPQQRTNMYSSAPAMTIDPNKKFVATIKTLKGSIVVELDAKSAPQTVNNFVFLARDGFYDNLSFHRVEPGFVIQGGDPRGTGQGGPGYTIPAEIKLKHIKGAIAMARLPDEVNPKRDSSGSQFYITLAATPFLDGGYTAFGDVTQGMDVVEKIAVGDVIQSVTIEEK